MHGVISAHRIRARAAIPALALTFAAVPAASAGAGQGPVGNAGSANCSDPGIHSGDELRQALDSGAAPPCIRLQAGDYVLERPLRVPDGTTLEGTGVMRVSDGTASGFATGPVATLRAAPGLQGDLLTLGDGSSLRNVRLIDAPADAGPDPGRAGNTVAIVSRHPHDRVAGRLDQVEVENGHPAGVIPEGPSGHAVVVLTRNPHAGVAGAHIGASVELDLRRSVIRAHGGGMAVFVLNFAAGGRVRVELAGNRLEGTLVAGGGASRPDAVTGAETVVLSRGNHYAAHPAGYDRHGWLLIAGSSAHLPGLAAPGASGNLLQVISEDDRIAGFRTGISAAGGRRWRSASGPVNDNRVRLDLRGTRISGHDPSAPDLVLDGALAAAEADGTREFTVGDGNRIEVRMSGVSGTAAPGYNHYADVSGPAGTEHRGRGNRLEFAGSRAQFLADNPGLADPPGGRFFAVPD